LYYAFIYFELVKRFENRRDVIVIDARLLHHCEGNGNLSISMAQITGAGQRW